MYVYEFSYLNDENQSNQLTRRGKFQLYIQLEIRSFFSALFETVQIVIHFGVAVPVALLLSLGFGGEGDKYSNPNTCSDSNKICSD